MIGFFLSFAPAGDERMHIAPTRFTERIDAGERKIPRGAKEEGRTSAGQNRVSAAELARNNATRKYGQGVIEYKVASKGGGVRPPP